jgi:ketopantoate reductase
MRALVVGAGAVGQVHGHHLARGGAQVGFLVKEAHEAEARAGFVLYPLNRPRAERKQPVRSTGFEVATSATPGWEVIVLAVPSSALTQGSWLAELARVVPDATVVLLPPGPDDRALVEQHFPAGQVVHGIISLLGYRAPLPGDSGFPEPGTAYWLPPLSPMPLDGAEERVAPVVAALTAGGLPARAVPGVAALAPFGTALLIPVVAALEAEQWSLPALRRSRRLSLAVRAAREASAALARRDGRKVPLPLRLLTGRAMLANLLRLAPLLPPFDLQTYLRVHFTKVRQQTQECLRSYIALAQGAGLPAEALRTLAEIVD